MFPQLVNPEDNQLSVEFPEQRMQKLSWIGLLYTSFMFPQSSHSVDHSQDFLKVETLLNSPVWNHILFILSGISNVEVFETTLDRFMDLQQPVFVDTQKSSRFRFRCLLVSFYLSNGLRKNYSGISGIPEAAAIHYKHKVITKEQL